MNKFYISTFIFSLLLSANIAAADPAVTKPIPIIELVNYQDYPAAVKTLITNAEKLTQLNLTYEYGSADPKNKGMDCSGTIYYLLNESGIKNIPRDADGMFDWVKKNGSLQRAVSESDFSVLKPGDLLFWSGTYRAKNEITHVMMYLGKNTKGQRLMFGSSDGRTYQGKKMWGVSVFDFKLHGGKDSGHFEGYSCIPNLTCKDIGR